LNHRDLSYDIEASARALGVDSLDAVLLHRDDPLIPVGEIVDALNDISRTHPVRAFGVSNWGVDRLAAAQQYAEKAGVGGFRLSSSQFSLAPWTKEPWPGCTTIAGAAKAKDREWYRTTSFPFLAWSSLAAGFFSDPPESSRGCIYSFPPNYERRARATVLAKEKDVTAPQIALAYVLTEPLNMFAVMSTNNIGHLRDNLRASEIELSDVERRWLNLETECRS